MEQSVMPQLEPPEIFVGWSRTAFKGEKSIREAGWALRFLLVCKGIATVTRMLVIAYLLMRWWSG
jgi:hypothetical protein